MSYRTQNILSLLALAAVLATCGYDLARAREIAAGPGLQAQACCSRSATE
jgi:hypothetical protein